ncbi:uncharacterized protein F4822DRAFT_443821 [Hypoxylon trugodes]|uniref:uncharacterized protein n=1 Tax=Hypoxylon trugodes TaxID=326681 RepID=UPI00219942C2|nr:uncharacterized protein F4822DRAFT_443821 [Hypoxylon trugodes]KAI1389138.1 hypothetical protein F4822DRAFT_443821 [Hypoxylon trugodes]
MDSSRVRRSENNVQQYTNTSQNIEEHPSFVQSHGSIHDQSPSVLQQWDRIYRHFDFRDSLPFPGPPTSYNPRRCLYRDVPPLVEALDFRFFDDFKIDQLCALLSALPLLLPTFTTLHDLNATRKSQQFLLDFIPIYESQIIDIIIDKINAKRTQAQVEFQERFDRLGRNEIKAKETDNGEWRKYLASELTQQDFHVTRNNVLQSPAYKWLLNSISRGAQLEAPSHNAQTKVQTRILQSCLNLPFPTSDREHRTEYNIVFQAPWIIKFFQKQDFEAPPYEVIDNIVVLTGAVNQAWASTCLQYVQLVWPDIGTQILDLHKSLLRQGSSGTCLYTLSDHTLLSAIVSQDCAYYTVTITGSAASIIDVIEVLVWFSTCLSSPKASEGIICQYPSCKMNIQARVCHEGNLGMCQPICVKYVHTPDDLSQTGECWTNMFQNEVLVTGYPTPRRPCRNSGLEMPLIMMTQLVNTNKINFFSEHMLIKGYSTILVPTRRQGGFVFWHMVSNEDGRYISYADARVKGFFNQYPRGLSVDDIERSRHILGWCTEVTNYAGSPDANYAISRSRLEEPSGGCVFDRITISAGMYVTPSASATIFRKAKSLGAEAQKDYTMRLKRISKQFVALYDAQERRAYLVDGASALLHLVRASLRHSLNDPFKSLCLYNESSLHESSTPHTGQAASISILTNEENLKIPLYAKPDTHLEETSTNESGSRTSKLSKTKTNYCLKDRIESICDTLEKITAHQDQISTQDGVSFKFKFTTRRQLEGFDFIDIATDEGQLRPRVAFLQTPGRGWVDLLREINAITLFGIGFGDLIRPAQNRAIGCDACFANVPIPKGRDFLAVCVLEWQNILDKWGRENESPLRSVGSIYWHAPDKTFEPCNCAIVPARKPKRIQELHPPPTPPLSQFWDRNSKSLSGLNLDLTPQGALLFGHSWKYLWRWVDWGAHGAENDTGINTGPVGEGNDSCDSSNPGLPAERRPKSRDLLGIGDIFRTRGVDMMINTNGAGEEPGEALNRSHLRSFMNKWRENQE